MLKRILNILKWVLAILVFVALCVLKPIPDQVLSESSFYPETMESIDDAISKKVVTSGKHLKVGWAKNALLDGRKHPVAGYARMGVEFGKVVDSLWVRSVYFENGETQAIYISFDLLIVPPVVYQQMVESLEQLGFSSQQIYVTATHSHSSFGGWQEGIMGYAVAGEYDEETVNFISKQALESVRNAIKTAKVSTIGAGEINADGVVRNRVVGDQIGNIDPWLKIFKVKNEEEEEMLITSYSAHPTNLKMNFTDISGEYPGDMIKKLEADSTVDFAVFGAGAMASMAPLVHDGQPLEQVAYMGDYLSRKVLNYHQGIVTNSDTEISYFSANISLPSPSFKINNTFAVREWVFGILVGEPTASVTSLKLGNTLFIGLPCDFSGELSEQLYAQARKKGMFLVINSFNGDYMGYITKDEWYYRHKSETRSMNWYGPNMGKFFSDIVSEVIDGY